MTKGHFYDAQTGEELVRDLTDEELSQLVSPESERIARLNETAKQRRRGELQAEADPLFFSWQRGETTEQEWLDKVAEIRARYPYA